MNCNIEYEEERKFCKYCGDPLVPKMEPISPQKKGGSTEEELDKKLICPDCQITYEFGSSCIQCGAALVRERVFSGNQKPKFVQKEPFIHLICPLCKTIYEGGESCVKCGANLVKNISLNEKGESPTAHQPKVEEEPIPFETTQEQIIEPPREKLICPHCKIIYERGNSCVRCGGELSTQVPAKDQDKTESKDVPEIPPGEPLPQDLGKTMPLDAEPIQKKETEVSLNIEVEVKEKTVSAQTIEEQTNNKLSDELEKRLKLQRGRKRDYRRIFLETGSISAMILAGGYFLWSIYSYIIKDSGAKAPSSKEVSTSVFSPSAPSPNAPPVVSTPQKTSPPSDVALIEALETEKIKDLLEKIRQANLEKNIELFISCYATDFKDMEVKKKTTLDNWKRYDYLDLTYDLKNPLISGDTAKVKVEWLIKISSRPSGPPQENRATLEVTLKKEEGVWKIKEVK